MAIYRTEHALVLAALEGAWGVRAQPSKRFGVHEQVTTPDMDNEYYPFFGISSGRSRSQIFRGRLALRGSVPDIKLQSTGADLRAALAYPIGRVSGNTILEGVSSTDERLNSMTMQVAMRDTSGSYGFIREFYGGKVARATYSAAEGEELRLSLDDIIFKDMAHNRSGVAKYSGAVVLGTDPGASGEPRFMFAGATISMLGVNVCKVRRFTLSVDNQLEPRYYLCKASGDPTNMTQVVNDIMEGKRVYAADIEIDVADPATDLELFDFMMNQSAAGSSSPTIGMIMTAQFQLAPSEGGSGTLTISCSLTTGAASPGTVIRSGKINIPPPPMGYFPTSWAMDVDHVTISTP